MNVIRNSIEKEKYNYLEMLKDCFSPEIVSLILDEDALKFKKDLKTILDNNKINPKKCNECPLNVEKKGMDFPGWLGKIDLTKKHRKDIMVVGFSPSRKIENVHVAFGLGYDYLSINDLNNIGPNSRRFWNAMIFLFDDDHEYINNNIYLTDLAYCNCSSKDKKTLRFCSKKHLLKEIEFINPKLIILNGYGLKKHLYFLPRPSVFIPHTTKNQTSHYFNEKDPQKSDKRWIEAQKNISIFFKSSIQDP